MGIVKQALNFSSFFLSFLSLKTVFVFSGVSSSLGSPYSCAAPACYPHASALGAK
jgi:hypothetical protein